MRVLLAEANARRAAALIAHLEAEAIRAEHIGSGDDALQLLRLYEFDLALIDTQLPDMSGLTLVGHVRSAKQHTPTIVFSALPQARQRALAAGADDAVEYDIDRDELVTRIRAVVRRSRGFSHSVLQIGEFTLDVGQHDVVARGVRVHLTAKEFATLQLLVLRRNMIMTKEAILSNLYGGRDEPEIKIIDVFVCKIRSKLARAGLPSAISTVWGRGYTVSDPGQDRTTASRLTPARAQGTYI